MNISIFGKSVNASKGNLSQGDNRNALLEWLGALDPLCVGKVSHFSDVTLTKLEALCNINQQANCEVKQVCKVFQKIGNEYEVLFRKKHDQLLCYGLDCEDLSSIINKTSLEISDLMLNGDVGDGTNAGAAIELADKVVESARRSRQILDLKSNIKIIKQRNTKLTECLDFHENQFKSFSEEAQNLQLSLKNTAIQNSICQAEVKQCLDQITSIKTQLDKLGIDSNISDHNILNDYKCLVEMHSELKEVHDRLKRQFEDLPPSVPDAVQQIDNMKKELTAVTERFKNKLLSVQKSTYYGSYQ